MENIGFDSNDVGRLKFIPRKPAVYLHGQEYEKWFAWVCDVCGYTKLEDVKPEEIWLCFSCHIKPFEHRVYVEKAKRPYPVVYEEPELRLVFHHPNNVSIVPAVMVADIIEPRTIGEPNPRRRDRTIFD